MEVVAQSSVYELERGKPTPDKLHAFIQQQLLFLIKLYYRETFDVLPVLNIIFDGEKSIPDLAIYKKNTLDFTKNETNVSEIPVGTIEILSGQQPLSELTSKLQRYIKAGVQSYWLVVSELQSIYVFHNASESKIYGKKDHLKDEVLKIELDLQEVFEGM